LRNETPPQLSPHIHYTLLQAYIAADKPEDALAHMEEVTAVYKIPLTPHVFETLARRTHIPLTLYRAHGLKPSHFPYHSLLDDLMRSKRALIKEKVRNGDSEEIEVRLGRIVAEAQEVFRELTGAGGWEPKTYTYNRMLEIHAENVDDVDRLLESMEKRRVEKDVFTFRILMKHAVRDFYLAVTPLFLCGMFIYVCFFLLGNRKTGCRLFMESMETVFETS
jgi:hypothetical protein